MLAREIPLNTRLVSDIRVFCSVFVTQNVLWRKPLASGRQSWVTRGGEGVAPEDCPKCGGSGYVAKPLDLNGKSEGVAFIRMKCPACGGTGRKRPISPTTAG
jgi:hypothetical protein